MAGAQAAEIAAAAQEGGAEPVGVFVEEGAAAIEAACDAAGLRTAQLHGDGARAALRTLPERLAAIYAMAVDPAAGYAIATPTPVELIEAAFADAAPDPNAWTKPNNWITNGNARGRRTVDYLLLDGLRGGSGEVRAAPPGEGLGPAGPLEVSGGSGTDPGNADAPCAPARVQALDWGRLSPPTGCSRKGWALAGGLHPGNVAEALRACPAANRPAVVDVSSGVCDASGLAKDHAKITAFLEQVALASSQLV